MVSKFFSPSLVLSASFSSVSRLKTSPGALELVCSRTVEQLQLVTERWGVGVKGSNSGWPHIRRVGSDGQSTLSGQEVPFEEFTGLWVMRQGLLCDDQETAQV